MNWNWIDEQHNADTVANCWFWYARGLRNMKIIRRIYLGLAFGRTWESYE